MSINHLFTAVMLIHAVLAFDWSVFSLRLDMNRKIEKRIICCLGMASGIWSLGFGLMFIASSFKMAYAFRSFGLIGVLGYLVAFMMLVSELANVSLRLRHISEVLSLLGIVAFFIGILPNQVEFSMSDWGMTYAPVPGMFNYFYTAYFFGCAGFIFFEIALLMRKKTKKSIIKTTRKLVIAGIIVMGGMLFDTVFPMFGFPNIPGSSVFQFYAFALISVYFNFSKSTPTMANFSGYVYDSLSIPIFIFDDNREMLFINNAAEKFFGATKEELVSFLPYYREFFKMETEDPFSFEGNGTQISASYKPKDLHCSIQLEKLQDEYGDIVGYLVAVHDVSGLESVVHSLEEANNAKNIFLANMSHEIRTPMNSIMGFAELLGQTPDVTEQKEYVDNIMTASKSLLGIVNNVLDITKVQAGTIDFTKENYDLKKNLARVTGKYQDAAKRKGITFKTMIDESIPPVLIGDSVRIRMLLNALLSEAMQDTSVGFVVLEAKVVEQTADEVSLRFQVRDSGSGIKDEDKETYFDAFATVGEKNGGMLSEGLELAIAKSYVESIGGTVHVESILGKGTTTTIQFTQSISTEEAPYLEEEEAVTVSSMTQMKLESAKVLVVDDNQININLAKRCLEKYGLVVSTALSGAESVEACKAQEFAIVFMDQMMPEMDGIEAMQLIRKLSPFYAKGGAGKIVALTADAIKGTREKLLGLGFDEYLSKPLEFDKLERVLRLYMQLSDGGAKSEKVEKIEKVEKVVVEANKAEEDTLIIPGVDVAKGISLCGESMELYLEILEMTITTGREKLAVMDQSRHTDIKSFIIDIHAVKGICYNIGADTLGDKAKALEFAGKEDRLSDIEENYPVFEKEFEAFLKMLEELLVKKGILQAEEQDDASFVKFLETVKQAVDHFDFPQAAKQISQMKQMTLTAEEAEDVKQLEEMIDAIDLDGVYPILERAMARY